MPEIPLKSDLWTTLMLFNDKCLQRKEFKKIKCTALFIYLFLNLFLFVYFICLFVFKFIFICLFYFICLFIYFICLFIYLFVIVFVTYSSFTDSFLKAVFFKSVMLQFAKSLHWH